VALDRIADRMADETLWKEESFRRAVVAGLPEHRLSKFEHVLPDAFVTEMVAAYLLDTNETTAYLSRAAG
jgi:hypothetical protein